MALYVIVMMVLECLLFINYIGHKMACGYAKIRLAIQWHQVVKG